MRLHLTKLVPKNPSLGKVGPSWLVLRISVELVVLFIFIFKKILILSLLSIGLKNSKIKRNNPSSPCVLEINRF
jgi:hypothetical protein